MKERTVKLWLALGLLLVILAGSSLTIVREWRALTGYWDHAGLRYETGGLSGEQLEAYQKGRQADGAAAEDPVEANRQAEAEDRADIEIAAWKRENHQTVTVEELGQSADGTVVRVSGNIELVFPDQKEAGGFPLPTDRAGCVISRGLALNLFGTTNVVGNRLCLGETTLIVRGVLKMEEPLLALPQTDGTERMPYVEIRTRGRASAPGLSQLAGGLGLFGEAYAFCGSFYVSLGRLFLSLPFWCAYFLLGPRLLKWRRKKRGSGYVGEGLFLAGIGVGLALSVSFTPDFIPARWSDFEFWGRKIFEIAEWIRARRDFPVISWEMEVLGRLWRIGAGALVSVASLLFFHAICHMENARKTVAEQRIS